MSDDSKPPEDAKSRREYLSGIKREFYRRAAIVSTFGAGVSALAARAKIISDDPATTNVLAAAGFGAAQGAVIGEVLATCSQLGHAEDGTLSRRAFLKGSAATATAAAVGGFIDASMVETANKAQEILDDPKTATDPEMKERAQNMKDQAETITKTVMPAATATVGIGVPLAMAYLDHADRIQDERENSTPPSKS